MKIKLNHFKQQSTSLRNQLKKERNDRQKELQNELKRERDQFNEIQRQKEAEIKQLKETNAAQQELIGQVSSHIRNNVTCQVCNGIFVDPVKLPCSNTICRSHLSNFNENCCLFCKQSHGINLNDEVILNERISEAITEDFYLSWHDKNQKMRIKQLFDKNRANREVLKKRQAEVEVFCFDRFAQMMNDVDMKKEKLKEKIDDFAEELINRIKQCKSTHEIVLKQNAIYDSNFMEMGNLVLSDGEISKLESGFNEDSRKYEKFNDMFESLESKLNQNVFALNKKIDGIMQTEKELNQCSFISSLTVLNRP